MIHVHAEAVKSIKCVVENVRNVSCEATDVGNVADIFDRG